MKETITYNRPESAIDAWRTLAIARNEGKRMLGFDFPTTHYKGKFEAMCENLKGRYFIADKGKYKLTIHI